MWDLVPSNGQKPYYKECWCCCCFFFLLSSIDILIIPGVTWRKKITKLKRIRPPPCKWTCSLHNTYIKKCAYKPNKTQQLPIFTWFLSLKTYNMYYFCVVSCQKQILFVVVCISSLKHCTHGPLKKKFYVAELTATTMFGGGECDWRHHDGSTWGPLSFYGVVDKMPLRPIIIASWPTGELWAPGATAPPPPPPPPPWDTKPSHLLSSCTHADVTTSGLIIFWWGWRAGGSSWLQCWTGRSSMEMVVISCQVRASAGLITVMGGALCVRKIAIFLITGSVAPVLMISRGSRGGEGWGRGIRGGFTWIVASIFTKVVCECLLWECFEVLRVASTSVQVHLDGAVKVAKLL